MAGLHMQNLLIPSNRAIPLQASHQKVKRKICCQCYQRCPCQIPSAQQTKNKTPACKETGPNGHTGDCRGESGELLYLGVMRHNHFQHRECCSDTFVLWCRALLPQKDNSQEQQRR